QAVLTSLLVDARAGGVHLPPAQRPRVVQLQQQAARLAARFAQLASAPATWSRSSSSADHLRAQLRSAHSPAVGRAAYTALYTPAAEAEACVEQLLATRAALAQAVGEPSFAHLALRSKVLASPDAVTVFLDALTDALEPHVAVETALL